MISLPHVTVLMGTRNGGAYLSQQLASLTAQDHANWSLWISDDNSTDATWSIIRAFAKTCPNPVILLRGPRRGSTINYLTLLCHPDLPPGPVAFADQDDIWLPTHLSRGLTALAQDDTPPAAGQAYVPHRLLLRSGKAPHPMPWRIKHQPGFRNALVESLLAGSGLILDGTATALARQGGVVDAPFWDWWLYLLLSGAEARIFHDAYPSVMYRAHRDNQLGPRYGARAALWRMYKLLNGTYRHWINTNLALLETNFGLLTPDSQDVLRLLLPQHPRPRLRQLSTYRQWPQDRLAVWLTA